MIIVKLKGGLGNQMFQYATGRRIAIKNKAELKLDLANYPPDCQRKYRLDEFNIKAAIADEKEINFLKPKSRLSFAWVHRKINNKFLPYYMWNHVTERPFFADKFDKNILNIGDNTYIEGYWASEKYFSDEKETIRNELTLNKPDGGLVQDIRRKIMQCDSVSIHFRRTDFAHDQGVNATYGLLGNEYYYSAIDRMSQALRDPHFFAFSDDIEWVRQNFRIKFPLTFVSKPDLMDFEELSLMSSCKHNIVANSSFSWWGAWLNKNPSNIVIAPKHWFKNPALSDEDLVPLEWQRV